MEFEYKLPEGIRLQERALLVKLSLSVHKFRRQDKSASRQVIVGNKVDDNRAKVRTYKNIVSAEITKKITELESRIRGYHYMSTLPYDDSGYRMIAVESLVQYRVDMAGYNRELSALVNWIESNWESAIEEARFLGDLFDENDYPPFREIKRKFSFSVEFFPISSTEHLRGLPPDIEKELVESTNKILNERVDRAMKEVWGRVFQVIKHVEATLSDPKKRFWDSLTGNVEELIGLLDGLNITRDPGLTDASAKMRRLLKYDPETLRSNILARTEIAREAAKILTDIEGPKKETKKIDRPGAVEVVEVCAQDVETYTEVVNG